MKQSTFAKQSEATIKELIHRLEDSWDVAIHSQKKGSLANHIYHLSDEEMDWIVLALRFAAEFSK